MDLAPALTSYDPADLLLSYTELLCELSLEDTPGFPPAAYLGDLLDRQEVHPVRLAGVVRLPEPSFGDCIADVLAPGAKPPMPVVLARTEVALMTDFYAVRDGAYAELVSEAMGIDHPGRAVLSPRAVPEEAVTLKFRVARELAARSRPGPAVIWTLNVDLGPVSFLDREDTHNRMLYKNGKDSELERKGLNLDDYDDDVLFA